MALPKPDGARRQRGAERPLSLSYRSGCLPSPALQTLSRTPAAGPFPRPHGLQGSQGPLARHHPCGRYRRHSLSGGASPGHASQAQPQRSPSCHLFVQHRSTGVSRQPHPESEPKLKKNCGPGRWRVSPGSTCGPMGGQAWPCHRINEDPLRRASRSRPDWASSGYCRCGSPTLWWR